MIIPNRQCVICVIGGQVVCVIGVKRVIGGQVCHVSCVNVCHRVRRGAGFSPGAGLPQHSLLPARHWLLLCAPSAAAPRSPGPSARTAGSGRTVRG